MHVIKQRTPRYSGSATLYVEIAGQIQGLPPLLEAKPGMHLAVLDDQEAHQLRIIRELRKIDDELRGVTCQH
jgi:hypothetical protein